MTRELALFGHLLGAFVLVAGMAVAAAAAAAARRQPTAGHVAALLALARMGVALVGLGSLLVLAFGLWLVDLTSARIGSGWVAAALALFALAVVLGALGGQRPKQARRLATRLAGDDAPATAELRALLDDPLSRAANWLAAVLMLAILALMVWQPGGR